MCCRARSVVRLLVVGRSPAAWANSKFAKLKFFNNLINEIILHCARLRSIFWCSFASPFWASSSGFLTIKATEVQTSHYHEWWYFYAKLLATYFSLFFFSPSLYISFYVNTEMSSGDGTIRTRTRHIQAPNPPRVLENCSKIVHFVHQNTVNLSWHKPNG